MRDLYFWSFLWRFDKLNMLRFVGHDLLTRLKLPGNSEEDTASTLDNLEEQKQVKRLITYLENRVDKLQNLLEDRDRSLSLNLQYEDFQRNVKHVSVIVKVQSFLNGQTLKL